MAHTIDTLFLVGHGKDDGERATVSFVLANIEVEKPGKKVEVVFIIEGETMAIEGKAAGFNIGVPFETYDLETRIKEFQKKGGIVNVCTPCLIHRKLQDAPLLEGVIAIKGPDMLEKKDQANKILQFL